MMHAPEKSDLAIADDSSLQAARQPRSKSRPRWRAAGFNIGHSCISWKR
jgi:hypothetical protein